MRMLIVYFGWTNPDEDTQLPLFRELAKRLDFLYIREPISFRKILRRRRRGKLVKRPDGVFYLEPVSLFRR